MYCRNCGASLKDTDTFCTSCGAKQTTAQSTQPMAQAAPAPVQPSALTSTGLRGFSPKINDPAFEKYIKKTNQWAAIFSIGIAVIAVIGFTVYGEIGSEIQNPQAFYYGLGIGGMFLVIGLLTILSKKSGKTWDGTVVDKRIQRKRRRQNTGDDDSYWVDYMEYSVIIRSDDGKTHVIKVENDDTLYNYYIVGERLRHHGKLNTYEKYDKTGERVLFCAACASMNPIENECCFRCKCPLLK